MRVIHSLVSLLVLLVTVAGMAGVHAQNYPAKPIRIIAGGAGGGTDLVARILATELGALLGQQMIVDNRPAGPAVAVGAAQAAPDGYTLMVNGSTLWTAPFFATVTYDVQRDFAPIIAVGRVPNLLVVHPSVPVKSVADLIKLAKAKPGQLNIATGPDGGSQHLSSELFQSLAGIEAVRIAYKGGPQQDVLTGQVHFTFGPAGTWTPHIKSGRVRALASTGSTRSFQYPDLPTVGEILPGYVQEGLNGLFAQAKAPEAIIRRLNQEAQRAIEKPEVRDRLLGIGQETVGGSPAQFAETIKAEIARVGRIAKMRDTGVKP